MKSSRKSLKKSRIFEKDADTRNIRKFSNSKYPHPTEEAPGGEALDASEDKEKSLLDWLKDILVRLPKCEKALNLFMERKRVDFPRYCFMSNVIYLDILSNGNDPTSNNKFLK